MPLDLRKSVEILWKDAKCSLDGSIPELPIMRSIGVIIVSDKEKVIICSLFGSDNDPRITQVIPRSLIRSIKKLK